MVNPGQGISLFIKQMLTEGLVHVGTHGAPGTPPKAGSQEAVRSVQRTVLVADRERPDASRGLQLVFDGEPPGHCTLTVERAMTLQAFLALVSLVHFESMGTDYYGVLK